MWLLEQNEYQVKEFFAKIPQNIYYIDNGLSLRHNAGCVENQNNIILLSCSCQK